MFLGGGLPVVRVKIGAGVGGAEAKKADTCHHQKAHASPIKFATATSSTNCSSNVLALEMLVWCSIDLGLDPGNTGSAPPAVWICIVTETDAFRQRWSSKWQVVEREYLGQLWSVLFC